MKIAIMGSGGVGGYFGALLARSGHSVTFIARGRHLEAIQANGLAVRSVNGDFDIRLAQATDDPSGVGACDFVLVAVKHTDLKPATEMLPPLLTPSTIVIPVLNGVDAHEILADALGVKVDIAAGFCSVVSMIEAPGVIRQPSNLRRVVVGYPDGHRSASLEELVQVWQSWGVDAYQSSNILAEMWNKFLFIASFGGVSSLVGGTAGEILADAETRRVLISAMQEVYGLAAKAGIPLAEDAVERAVAMLDSMEPNTTSSMQRDVTAGKPFELEAFSGKIVHMARQLAHETPIHDVLYALLRPQLNRATRG